MALPIQETPILTGDDARRFLQRMNELAVKAANGTNMDEDRGYIQKEIEALQDEIDRVAETTTFNDQALLKAGTTFNLQVGAESTTNNQIAVEIGQMDSAGLGVDSSKVKVGTESEALTSIENIKAGIKKLNEQRADLGAQQNRLEHTIKNLDNVVENTTAAESRIRDTDMAEEMVEFSKNNILAQAGQSMLAQANQSTQGVLSLLR